MERVYRRREPGAARRPRDPEELEQARLLKTRSNTTPEYRIFNSGLKFIAAKKCFYLQNLQEQFSSAGVLILLKAQGEDADRNSRAQGRGR